MKILIYSVLICGHTYFARVLLFIRELINFLPNKKHIMPLTENNRFTKLYFPLLFLSSSTFTKNKLKLFFHLIWGLDNLLLKHIDQRRQQQFPPIFFFLNTWNYIQFHRRKKNMQNCRKDRKYQCKCRIKKKTSGRISKQ